MHRWTRVGLSLFALALLTAAYERLQSNSIMTDAARAYLASLPPDLRARTMFPFATEERMNWHFVPIERKGVALREMNSEQKHLAEALLAAGLSQRGVIKAHTIMSLDQVLKEMEKGGKGPERDPEKYYVSIFGEPTEQGTWGYRFEGHHISLNFTIVNGRIASSPNFFGANPAEVKEGPRVGPASAQAGRGSGPRYGQVADGCAAGDCDCRQDCAQGHHHVRFAEGGFEWTAERSAVRENDRQAEGDPDGAGGRICHQFPAADRRLAHGSIPQERKPTCFSPGRAGSRRASRIITASRRRFS